MITIESVDSMWYFDPSGMRFCQRQKDRRSSDPSIKWRPYYGLELRGDSGTFLVKLDPGGHRFLRSWGRRSGNPERQETSERGRPNDDGPMSSAPRFAGAVSTPYLFSVQPLRNFT